MSYIEYFTDILDLVISCNFEKQRKKIISYIYKKNINSKY